jgi:ribosomal protein S6--L-glutamate ligase
MKIVLLSRRSRSYSTARLVEAARARGHVCRAVDPDECSLVLDGATTVLYHKSRRLLNVSLIMPRLGAQASEFAVSLLDSCEELGVPCMNGPAAMALAKDKLRLLRQLGRAGIAVPPTLLCRRPEEIGRKVALIGGPPVVLRGLHGSHGVQAIAAEDLGSIVSIVESFWEAGRNILLQRAMTGGREVRAYVVGGRVIAALRRPPRALPDRGGARRARPGARGAGWPLEVVELTRPCRALAIRSAEALGLSVASVDLFEGRGGARVLDVNPAPGLEEVERATETDVATEVVRFAETFVARRAGLALSEALST